MKKPSRPKEKPVNTPVTPERIAFLGNFVPRMCGIATFTHDLYNAVAEAAPEADCYVAAVTDTHDGYDYPEAVKITLHQLNGQYNLFTIGNCNHPTYDSRRPYYGAGQSDEGAHPSE